MEKYYSIDKNNQINILQAQADEVADSINQM
jgi:hypothetical protein